MADVFPNKFSIIIKINKLNRQHKQNFSNFIA